jgi:hypothetical protein
MLWVVSLAGCLADRVDLVRANRVRIEPAPAGTTALSAPIVWAQDGKLVVLGSMAHQGSHHHHPGHVHVVVRSASGEELGRQQVRLRERDAGARVMRKHRANYTAEFAKVPPDGSTVQVWHCHDEHDTSG